MYSVTYVEVDWMEGWANSPRLLVKFERDEHEAVFQVLKGHEHRYTRKEQLYRSILGERADFLFHPDHGKTNAGGYGGRIFTILMEDGKEVNLPGPYSSNSSSVNEVFKDGRDVVEVTIIKDDKTCLLSGAATVAGIVRWIKENKPDFGFVLTDCQYAPYQPCHLDGTVKDSKHKILQRLA